MCSKPDPLSFDQTSRYAEVRDLAHERRHHLRVVLAHARMRQRHREARLERPERVIDARAAQHRVTREELLGDGTRLEREQPGHEAVRPRQGRVPLENREIGRQVIGGIEARVERRAHELIQGGAVRVEHRVRLPLGAGLETHGVGEGVDLDVREAPGGELADVGLGIEPLLDPPLLGQEEVVARAVPREGRRDRHAALEGTKIAASRDVEQVGRRPVQHVSARAGETAGAVRLEAEIEPGRHQQARPRCEGRRVNPEDSRRRPRFRPRRLDDARARPPSE